MRVLLSTIGSRGDVQPLVALASQLKALGQEVRLCVPPDFRDWIEGLGIPVTPIGPELRKLTGRQPTGHAGPTLARAAASAGGRHGRHAVRDDRGGRPRLRRHRGSNGAADRRSLGGREDGHPLRLRRLLPDGSAIATPRAAAIAAYAGTDAGARNGRQPRALGSGCTNASTTLFGAALNSHRASLGLAPVSDVRSHIFTDRPWLAADPTLAPWPDPADQAVFQTGAWILPDERPLSPELEAFLDAGEPPVYFGFGSIRAPQDLSQVMIQSARALGRRAIVSRGWADLSLVDDEPDCLAIGEVNQQALFTRVAAVVHHGGAGTTTAAALAGAPQVVIPQIYDQHYWAQRIHHLGIGTAHAPGAPTTDSLTSALEHTLQPDVAARARSIAAAVRRDGAQVAAQRLISADR